VIKKKKSFSELYFEQKEKNLFFVNKKVTERKLISQLAKKKLFCVFYRKYHVHLFKLIS